jgi:hypothetical protein
MAIRFWLIYMEDEARGGPLRGNRRRPCFGGEAHMCGSTDTRSARRFGASIYTKGIDARIVREAMITAKAKSKSKSKPKLQATEPRLLTAEELRNVSGGDSGGGKIIIFQ